MSRFHIGDDVRVSGMVNSQWRGMSGRIVEIVERVGETSETLEEFAVMFKDQRRWFMGEHLVKAVSSKLVRFFRSEVAERWHLDPADVGELSGDREELVRFLRDRYDFATRRAQVEVDDFFVMFQERIDRATETAASSESLGNRGHIAA